MEQKHTTHDAENAPPGAHIYQCDEHPEVSIWLMPPGKRARPMRCGICLEPLADRGLVKPGTHN